VIFEDILRFWREFSPLIRWWDLIDILVVAFFIHQAFLFLKGTRAFQLFLTLSLLFLFFWISERFQIRTVRAVLGSLFDNWVILLVLLFHQDIRRALSQFGVKSFLSASKKEDSSQLIEELVRSAVSLANKKIGALLVVEREADLSDFIEAGEVLDSRVSKDVLTSLFLPVSPLHDGAAVIRKGRIFMAGCFLPLSLNPLISKALGTRHRAALGITEETDAICLVISEEKGSVSFASAGKISHDLEAGQLRKLLTEALK
jgi:diadenylate cyclase